VGFFVFLITCLVTIVPAQAQNLHFVSLAWVNPDKQVQYDRFNQLVAPIWARHGMEVLLRAKVIGALNGGDPNELPSEIAVLRIASRTQFEDYIADPAYRSIRPLRTEAVDRMTVLEGTGITAEANPRLSTAPQFAMVFGPPAPSAPRPVLQLVTTEAGSIKGAVPSRYASHPLMTLFVLSFDDSPMAFNDPEVEQSSVIILQPIN
jgi:uncharacterized protein (DUF1330 family)